MRKLIVVALLALSSGVLPAQLRNHPQPNTPDTCAPPRWCGELRPDAIASPTPLPPPQMQVRRLPCMTGRAMVMTPLVLASTGAGVGFLVTVLERIRTSNDDTHDGRAIQYGAAIGFAAGLVTVAVAPKCPGPLRVRT